MVKTVSLCVEEGQLVWFQSSEIYLPSEYVKVNTVCRLWASLSNGYRCNRYTGVVDGGKYRSPGTVYCTKEDYEHEVRVLRMWKKLQKDVAHKKFLKEDISRRQILAVRRLLKLDE